MSNLLPRSKEADKITTLIDYVQFCGSGAIDKDEPVHLLGIDNRISADELSQRLSKGDRQSPSSPPLITPYVIDVRTGPEFEMGSIAGSVNMPLSRLDSDAILDQLITDADSYGGEIVFVCRRGNDSQRAGQRLINHIIQRKTQAETTKLAVKDVVGGLVAWARNVDTSFPIY